MKKVVAILLAGVLVLGGAVTAFAAGSQEADTGSAQVEVSSAVDANGTSVAIVESQTYTTTADTNAAAALKKAPLDTLQSVVPDAASDTQFVTVMDVRIEGDASKVTFPVTITFKVSGVTTDSTVYVLHYENGAWHQEDCTLGDGTVTVSFDSLSPVAIYVDKATAERAGLTTGTSPQTGEAPIAAVATMVALCAVAGLVVSSRRRHA